MGGDRFRYGRGGDGDGELRLGMGAGPVELGHVMGERVHRRAEGEQVGVAGGAVVDLGHGANSRGLGTRVAGNG